MSEDLPSAGDGRAPTTPERACFEAGIKFGSLYHQFAGTPVSPDSADALATAMATAIENQPHCESVSVAVDHEALATAVADGPADYVELTGRFLEVELAVVVEATRVEARMATADGYPRMRVTAIEEPDG